ncbi:hypothetical protein ACFQRL_11270 [Microbacterium fluvii]|uniref:Uncharacterized protein n=1 Tax=Microbacterium fluvii TaxID=415215 RepID=A0ABW2HGG9_9MICO|nr:hypothetical protein [Microbacterium fluvii]MCU4673175.1 hypothetical protein [Microbacterium fluvii]
MSPNAALASRSLDTLTIAPPPGQRERVVRESLAEIAKNHKGDLATARRVIADYGLSIEVARLRDRLSRAAQSDAQRLLLSTPGVAETLFLAAIKPQLEAAQQAGGDSVLDAVEDVGDEVGALNKEVGELNKTAKALADAVAAFLGSGRDGQDPKAAAR